jgi:predicted dehydrogenase
MEQIRWGILGTGAIAQRFATGLQALPDHRLAAVGSRSLGAAERFADTFGAVRRHASYAALVEDPTVDAVYVATPHPFHAEHSLLCLEAGKPVLCEKPFSMNAAEAEQVLAAARAHGRFVMEAMWTRFIPAITRLRELLASGLIGEARELEGSFGFFTPVNPESRLFKLELGGGALLDVGVYLVSFASMLFGEPVRVTSTARIGNTGVDEQCAAQLGYAGGQVALVSAAIRRALPNTITVRGTGGTLTLLAPFWRSTRLRIEVGGRSKLEVYPLTGNGYNYQAAEVARCLRAGLTESPIMPLDETLAVMRTLDRIREPWGLLYPADALRLAALATPGILVAGGQE